MDRSWMTIFILVALIAVIVLLVVIYTRTKRKKDTVIKQLLQGNDEDHEIKIDRKREKPKKRK